MKKKILTVGFAIILSLSAYMTAFAGSWQQDNAGWWYQNDDGSFPTNQWQWIDGNNDGTAECYYFDSNGYMLNDTKIDGSSINADGVWTVDGVVQTQATNTPHNNNNNLNKEDPNNPYANDPFYLSMKKSAFEKLATMDFNQDEIKLKLTDIVFEANERNYAIIKYVALEVRSYCNFINSKFNNVKWGGVMIDDNIFGTKKYPYITVDEDPNGVRSYTTDAYKNDPLYIRIKDSALTKMATADFSEGRVNLDLTDVTYDESQVNKVRKMGMDIFRDIRSVYSNIMSISWYSEKTDDGLYYVRLTVRMGYHDK